MSKSQVKIIYTTLTDEELAILCKHGDELAFREIMNRYIYSVHAFVHRYTQHSEDTDDVIQDAFFKAWKHIKSFKIDKKFKPWLYTIIRNTALDYIKKKRTVPFSSLDDAENDIAFTDTLSDSEPLASELFEQTEIKEEITVALQTLHPDHRNILIMHYREHMTFEDIATIMEKPMNTVKSWHQRALKKLKTELKSRSAPK